MKEGKTHTDKIIKHPIQRVAIAGSIVFVVLLCVVLSTVSFRILAVTMTERYEDKFNEILEYASGIIDADDLESCINSKEPSEKYIDLQEHYDLMLEDFELDHLYCVIVSNTTVWNVVSAQSREERDKGLSRLGIREPYRFFPQKELQRYLEFYRSDEVSYFDELTFDGLFYTAAKPIKNSEGETIAMLCIDVSVTELSDLIMHYVIPVNVMMVIICSVFALLLILWLRSQITKPIGKLEYSVGRFAGKSHMMKGGGLKLELPELHTENEVQSLASAIEKMSVDMQAYVDDMLNAENRAESAEKEAQDMTEIAYRDALTNVGSKAAYDIKTRELENKIKDGTAEFAFVMVDLNNLKLINDNFGHAKGNEYLNGSCRQLCSIFRRTSVYRIGGDEFIVVLEGDEYTEREELFAGLRKAFEASRTDPERELWQCYSAAGGMAAYDSAIDESVDDVFRRADAAMYADKQSMKSLSSGGGFVDRSLQDLTR